MAAIIFEPADKSKDSIKQGYKKQYQKENNYLHPDLPQYE
jgi:hypothetical protein